MRQGWSFLLTSCALLVAVLGANLSAETVSRNYRNERWGFCVAYPGGWSGDEGVDKAGILIARGHTEISVGALPNQPLDFGRGRPMTLEEIADSDLAVFGVDSPTPVERVAVLQRKHTTVAGASAIEMEIKYTDNGVRYAKRVIFALKDATVYEFQLHCKESELSKCSGTFNRILNSFEWHCGPRH